MANFRLMQISDSHFCEVPDRHNIKALMNNPPALSQMYRSRKINPSIYPSSFDRDIAFGAAEFIRVEAGSCDAIIISGDLATTGRPDDLEVAHFFVVSKSSIASHYPARPYIGQFIERTLLSPGNHDRYANNFGKPWSASFDLIFGKLWSPKIHDVKYRIIGDETCPVCLVLVDFCLRANKDAGKPYLFNRYGRGKAYEDTVARLNSFMSELKDLLPNVSIVLVSHFPPIDNCDSVLKLIDHEKVLNSANQHSVEFILSGHLHSNDIYTDSNGLKILSAGSVCSAECGDDCWIHIIDFDVEDGNLVRLSKMDFKWDSDEGGFVDCGTTTIL